MKDVKGVGAERKTCYVTTPLYYVNAQPHLGTLYSTLLADLIARWQRFSGKEVFFLTGTDEHGEKIATKAAELGKQPLSFIDTVVPKFHAMWEKYNLSYDRFIRTTEHAHKQTVTAWIEKLQAQGDIYKDTYEGLYCTPCETFVTEDQALVKTPASAGELDPGTSPGRRSDVKTSASAGELDPPGSKSGAGSVYLCPSCERGLKKISEENYFFRLSAYQERLLEFYKQNPDFVQPKERLNEVLAFIEMGLKDLSISRKTVSWGIPFPGDPEHTVYVWGDALMNYVSALGYLQGGEAEQLMEKFWPANVQVMAKDIVRFHAIFFPAFLMAAGIEPAQKLLVHGYILVDNDKMSKSKGNSVDPGDLANEFGVDQVRYYLSRYMVTSRDGNFTITDLAQKIGSDLANGIGNLLQRTASLGHKYGVTNLSGDITWSERSLGLKSSCNSLLTEYKQLFDTHQFDRALASLFKFVGQVNQYFTECEPWKLGKTDKKQFTEVLAATAQSLYIIGHLISPVMPQKSEQLLAALGHTIDKKYSDIVENRWDIPCTLHIPSEPLFARPDLKKYTNTDNRRDISMTEEKKTVALDPGASQGVENGDQAKESTQNYITFDEFLKVELAVGLITACEPVPKSKKLLCLQVDMGEYGQRQILSGIAQFYSPEDMIGKKAAFVVNLPPRQMMGTVSEGMLLSAHDGDVFGFVTFDRDAKPGTRLG